MPSATKRPIFFFHSNFLQHCVCVHVICTCSHVWACMYAGVLIHIPMCGGQKSISGVLYHSPPTFLKQGLSLSLEVISLTRHPPSAGVKHIDTGLCLAFCGGAQVLRVVQWALH